MGNRVASVSCHNGPVTALESGPDSTAIYSGGLDGTIREWRWETPNRVCDAPPLSVGEGNVSALAFNTRSSCLVSGYSDGRIEALRVPHGDPVTVFAAHSDVVSAIASSPTEQAFLSGSYDGTIVQFRCSSASARSVLTNPYDGPFTSVAWDRFGEYVATSAVRSPVIIWDTDEWTTSRTLGDESGTVVSLAFSPVSSQLVTVEYDGDLCVHDLEAGSPDVRKRIGERGDYPIAVNDAGTRIAVGTEHSVKIYDLDTGRLVDVHPFEEAGVFSVTFVPRTDTVAVGCGNGEIIVLDISSGSTSVSG